MQIKFCERLYAQVFYDEENVWGYSLFGEDDNGSAWESEKITGFLSPELAKEAAWQHVLDMMLGAIAERENAVAELEDKLIPRYREAAEVTERLARSYREIANCLNELDRHSGLASTRQLIRNYHEMAEAMSKLTDYYHDVSETIKGIARGSREIAEIAGTLSTIKNASRYLEN